MAGAWRGSPRPGVGHPQVAAPKEHYCRLGRHLPQHRGPICASSRGHFRKFDEWTSAEDDGLGAVEHDAGLAVPADGAGEDVGLDVAAGGDELVGGEVVVDAADVLL